MTAQESLSDPGYEYVPRSRAMVDGDILFGAVMLGHSMAPEVNEGDLIIFRPLRDGETFVDGDMVFVRFAEEHGNTCTVTRIWRRTDGRSELRPANPQHNTWIVAPSDIDRMAVAIEVRE